jgi:hypothetical protein
MKFTTRVVETVTTDEHGNIVHRERQVTTNVPETVRQDLGTVEEVIVEAERFVMRVEALLSRLFKR